MQFEKWYPIDLMKPQATPVDMGVLLCSGDENSVRVGVRVKSGNADTNVTGEIKGFVTLPSGLGVMPFDGAKSGNAAWIDLPEDALGMAGRITVAIRSFDGDETTVLLMAYATVRRVDADAYYDPDDVVGDITDLIEAADQAAAYAQQALADASNIVSYNDQTSESHTDAEKAQARANIGAASVVDIAGSTFSPEAKQAFIGLLGKIAYVDADAAELVAELSDLLIGDVELVSISATFSPGGHDFFTGTVLDDLTPYLTVTGTYSDGYTGTVTGYTLYGDLDVGENTITVAYGGKTTTFTATVVEIPSGYTRLAALTGTGTQYINTGKKFSGAGSYECQVKGLLSDNSTAQWYLGAMETISGAYWPIGLNSLANASTVYFRYAQGSGLTGHDFSANSTTEYTLKQDQGKSYVNGTLHSQYTDSSASMTINLYLFARNNNGNADNLGSCSIKEFKMWNGSNELVLDLIPCLDDNNTPCMFDKVGHGTLYNAGTGTFSYEEVSA